MKTVSYNTFLAASIRRALIKGDVVKYRPTEYERSDLKTKTFQSSKLLDFWAVSFATN